MSSELLKKIIAEGTRKAVEDSRIPFAVHKEAIRQLTVLIKQHQDEIKKYQKELSDSSDNRVQHEKQIAIHNRQINDYEAELARWKTISKGEKGEPGKTPVKGVDYFDGKNADPVTDERLLALIKSVMPEEEDKEESEDEDDEAKIQEALDKFKKTLTVDSIKGLREYVSGKKGSARNADGFTDNGTFYRFSELFHGGGSSTGGGSITYSVDLSSQCDGVNKTFTVPANTNFVQLSGTDSPIIYKYTTDYTGSGTTTLTLTAAVNAPSSGATLVLLYVV